MYFASLNHYISFTLNVSEIELDFLELLDGLKLNCINFKAQFTQLRYFEMDEFKRIVYRLVLGLDYITWIAKVKERFIETFERYSVNF